MRLLIALVQTVIIVGVGVAFFGVEITGPWPLTVVFVVLGAVAFLALGYVIASFAKTEDSANGMTSVVQFPMMFLSGTFFPIEQMPDFLQTIARLIPLTYLADALRQVMVGRRARSRRCRSAPPVLAGWLVVCFGIAAREVPLAVAAAGAQARGLPALLVDELVERPAAAGRGGRVRSSGSAG